MAQRWQTVVLPRTVPWKAVADNEPEAAEVILTQRQGGEIGLSKICQKFGEGLHEKLPQLTTDRVLRPLLSISHCDSSTQTAQNIVHALHVLDEIVPYVHTTVLDTLVDTLLPVTCFPMV